MNETHVSDLIHSYVTGALAPDVASRVEAHVEGCRDCAAEVTAARALVEAEEVRLSDLERTRLRREVMARLGDAQPAPSSSRGARLYAALATAAVMAVIGGFAYLGLGGGGDDAGESAAGGSAENLEDGDTGAGGTATLESAAPATFVRNAGRLSRAEVLRNARRGFALAASARALGAEDSAAAVSEGAGGSEGGGDSGEAPVAAAPPEPGAAAQQIDALAAQAPASARDQVRECASDIVAEQPTAIPVYGAIGTYETFDEGRALLLGFVWSNSGSGPLDDYMVWAWPLGSCDSPVEYLFGSVGGEQP